MKPEMVDTTQRFFAARPESVGLAREFADATLNTWGRPARAGDVRLCVSELATNAVVHGTAPGHGFLVRLDAEEDVVRVEVHDSRSLRPAIQQPTDTDVSGRGLLLVAALSDDWGVEDLSPFGKIVWFCCKARPQHPAPAVRCYCSAQTADPLRQSADATQLDTPMAADLLLQDLHMDE
ncbi:ATP-binding protein [Streptomyces sp. SGAir0957]